MSELQTNGVVFPHDPDVITQNIANAISAGRFEQEEAAELAHIVEPGDRILEIGAGTGFISTLLDRLTEVEEVVAVEANPALIPYMERLHEANEASKVLRMNAVLSNGDEDCLPFYVRDDFWMGSLSATPNAFRSVINVPVRCLDDVIAGHAITMIICDIEGAETTIFKDANLGGDTRIYLELHDHVTGLRGVGNLFDDLGRQGFVYDPRHSNRSVVLFRKVEADEVLRPFNGS